MRKVLAVAFLILSVASLSFASEITEEQMTTFYWRVAMFIVFVALLVYLLRKPIKNMLDGRTEAVRAALQEAERARDKAIFEMQKNEQRIKELESELEGMRTNAKKLADEERKVMLKDAEVAVEQIKRQAVTMINAEREKAKQDLRKEVVALATVEAEKMLVDYVKGAEADKMLKSYVAKVGGGK